jgi:hypothetical protein
MTRLRVLTAHEIEDPELRATVEKVGDDGALGIYGCCPDLNRTVRGRCYLHGFNGLPGALPEVADVGVYEDRIVKVATEWRFVSRSILMDGSWWTLSTMESAR